jgi:hypothetical protein
VKGNGGEDGAACLPTGDNGGGGSDRGGATTRGGGATAAQQFYLTNGDRCDDVWWIGGQCHPTGGPDGGVSQ